MSLPLPTSALSPHASETNRESRAMDALRMKDDQLRMLTEQNTTLLKTLDKVEAEANHIQLEKLETEEESRKLRDDNFELQSKNRVSEAALRKIESEIDDREKKVKIMTNQNSELLRLLETEESQTAVLEKERRELRDGLEALKGKYSSLLTTAKTHEEIAGRAAREGQLRAEELRLLRSECEQLRVQNADMERKSAVEIESLQEQLRVRKEKQYHLLEKMQGADESKRQAEDQCAAMTQKMRALHARTVELETQLQVETKAKRLQEEANRNLSVTEENLRRNNSELQEKSRKSEEERVRMESEARDSGEQLREMAEKVFQLLERLKLAELGKSKSIEQLRKCEQELVSVKKKTSRLLKESTDEGKQRVKAELDKKVLIDQVRALKSHNAELAHRCREEVKIKMKEHEERQAAEEKIKTLGGRLSFLLNKLQADEEVKIMNREEMKKMEAQNKTLHEKSDELLVKLNATGESNRIITQAMRLKQEEVEGLQLKYSALLHRVKQSKGGDESETHATRDEYEQKESSNNDDNNTTDEPDADQVRSSGGKGRFYTDPKPTQGMIFIKAKRASAKKILDRLDINGFLKRAQRSTKYKELVTEKLSHILGLLNVEEDDHKQTCASLQNRVDQVGHLADKLSMIQNTLSDEEESKRRTLLRYVQVVKNHTENGSIQLADGGVGDEEMHALSALIRGSTNIRELHLQNNSISDSGARALAAVLAGPPVCHLKLVDIRNNKITQAGVRILAEALERAQNTRHVYVHAGGKIEALGTCANPDESSASVTVETVCEVDVRDQTTGESVESPAQRIIPAESKPSSGRKTERRRKNKDTKADIQNKKQGWKGRVGGMDVSTSNLPPLTPPTASE